MIHACSCGAKLNVPDTLVGKRAKCPKCGEIAVVGSAPPAAPPRKGGTAVRARPAPAPPPEPEPEPEPPPEEEAPAARPRRAGTRPGASTRLRQRPSARSKPAAVAGQFTSLACGALALILIFVPVPFAGLAALGLILAGGLFGIVTFILGAVRKVSRAMILGGAGVALNGAIVALLILVIGFAFAGAVDSAKKTMCMNNLSTLWKLQHNYMVSFGGPEKLMPQKTGSAFWLELTRTRPPLIDATLKDILRCPMAGSGAEPCTYRGPARDVKQLDDEDVVGCCAEIHGDGSITVLQRNGSVQLALPRDPLHAQALSSTKR